MYTRIISTVLLTVFLLVMAGCGRGFHGEEAGTKKKMEINENSEYDEETIPSEESGVCEGSTNEEISTVHGESSANVNSNYSHEITFTIMKPGGITSLYWIDNENLPGIEIDAIPDMETAIDIANAIFRTIQRDRFFLRNYVADFVYYDEENGIWIVGFVIPGRNFVGGSISIALRKSDATVLKIWPGE